MTPSMIPGMTMDNFLLLALLAGLGLALVAGPLGCFLVWVWASALTISDVTAQDRIAGMPHATRSVVWAKNGIAATSHPFATQVALDILKAGGSAVSVVMSWIAGTARTASPQL